MLEARDRVGGRVYTLDEIPGHPEAGANVFGPNYDRNIMVAQKLRVNLASLPRLSGMGLMLDGQLIDRELWPESSLNTLPEALRQIMTRITPWLNCAA